MARIGVIARGAARLVFAGLAWRKTFRDSACLNTPWVHLNGNPYLEDLLVPSVFQIRAVALLDRALREFVKTRSWTIPRTYHPGRSRPDLAAHIAFLADEECLINRGALDAARERRNLLAHDPDTEITWAEFDIDAGAIEQACTMLRLLDFSQAIGRLRWLASYLSKPVHKRFYDETPRDIVLALAAMAYTQWLIDRESRKAALEIALGFTSE